MGLPRWYANNKAYVKKFGMSRERNWLTGEIREQWARNDSHWIGRKGGPVQIKVTQAFKPLLDGRFWARHPEPFSKTKAGKKRRAERRFVRDTQHRCDYKMTQF